MSFDPGVFFAILGVFVLVIAWSYLEQNLLALPALLLYLFSKQKKNDSVPTASPLFGPDKQRKK